MTTSAWVLGADPTPGGLSTGHLILKGLGNLCGAKHLLREAHPAWAEGSFSENRDRAFPVNFSADPLTLLENRLGKEETYLPSQGHSEGAQRPTRSGCHQLGQHPALWGPSEHSPPTQA